MDRRVVVALGTGLAVLAAVVIALMLGNKRDSDPPAPPAAQAGLQVDIADVPQNIDPSRELRCFVNGQFVGTATLAQCAERNGVSAQALDVGIDPDTGALAAAQTASLAPPPEAPPADVTETVEKPESPALQAPQPASPSGSPCLRYAGSEWRQVSGSTSLGQCVQTLFAGTCVRPGDAVYGRWGDQTLRLVPGRVEQSGDNSRFRTIASQSRNCAVGEVG